MKARAVADAETATFNNKNVVHRGYQAARRVVAKAPGGKVVNAGLDALLPTHARRSTSWRAPSNTLRSVPARRRRAPRSVLLVASTGPGQLNFARTMGRAATGTTLILLGYTLASKGLPTGAPGDDPRFSGSDSNAPPFSVRVGDEWARLRVSRLSAISSHWARLSTTSRRPKAACPALWVRACNSSANSRCCARLRTLWKPSRSPVRRARASLVVSLATSSRLSFQTWRALSTTRRALAAVRLESDCVSHPRPARDPARSKRLPRAAD